MGRVRMRAGSIKARNCSRICAGLRMLVVVLVSTLGAVAVAMYFSRYKRLLPSQLETRERTPQQNAMYAWFKYYSLELLFS